MSGEATGGESAEDGGPAPGAEGSGEPQSKKKRRRRKRKGRGEDGEVPQTVENEDEGEDTLGPRIRRAPADATNAEVFEQQTTFADLGLHPDLLRGLSEAGFVQPTYIQATLIPPAIAGRDVLGQAKTGTGKTAAFGLPLLQMCEPGVPLQAIILAPTRELAIQITDEITDLGRFTKVRVVTGLRRSADPVADDQA